VARDVQRGAGSSGPLSPYLGRRMLAALCCALLAAVAVGIVVKHGGGNGAAEAAATQARTPACASAPKGVTPPPEIPAAVLPPGTVITSVDHPRSGITLVSGVVPLQFRSAVEFFVTELPPAGFRNTVGDAEMDEAESFFDGPGVTGKWKVNGILACPDAVTLALYVER
jgi:hypothetical protein